MVCIIMSKLSQQRLNLQTIIKNKNIKYSGIYTNPRPVTKIMNINLFPIFPKKKVMKKWSIASSNHAFEEKKRL